MNKIEVFLNNISYGTNKMGIESGNNVLKDDKKGQTLKFINELIKIVEERTRS